MALRKHPKDQHGNIVAEEGCTVCTCGCKYWENDKFIDCGMTPERLWIIQQANYAKVATSLQLNVMFTTMLHYDLPWVKAAVSGDLDPLSIQERLLDVPNHGLVWAQPTDCDECGGSDNDHYLSCSVWDFSKNLNMTYHNRKVA